MLKKTLCSLIAVMCLIPSLALAGKSYDPIDIYHHPFIDDITFSVGDKFTSNSRISVELHYGDIYGFIIDNGNGTVKSVVIDGEKVTEWKVAGRTGSEIRIGNTVQMAAYGFTLKPVYAFADSEGYYSLTDKTYDYLSVNRKDKKVKFIGAVTDKDPEWTYISIAENAIVSIQTDTALEQGDRVICSGAITDKTTYKGTSILQIECESVAVQQYDPLKKGDKGEEVMNLKKRLQELGYFGASASFNDVYGDPCVDQVKAFQKNNGLTVTGTADSETLTVLYSDIAKGK